MQNIMMREASDKGVFKGLKISTDNVEVTHLHFVDDVIFFYDWSGSNASNLVKLLRCFEDASGLRIHLSKNKLFDIGVLNSEVTQVAASLHCTSGPLPFMYLGFPIGAKMRLSVSWEEVKQKFHKKLNSWKAATLSMGERLTLVKSVPNSFLIYYLSLFRAPTSVITNLEKRRNKFMWGSIGTFKKIVWAGYSKSAENFNSEGLEVGSIKAKNITLLSKC